MTIADEADAPNRGPITVCIMLATVMNALDTTIANVALPHMAGNVSASADQITWVLTSYIVAGAVVMPLTGWAAARFGRKTLFLVAIGGFTLSSMLCGIASSLPEIVVFRLMQGAFGAPLMPLSQAQLLDINPPEKHGQAMSIWSAGVLIGPILGPTLGGYLTDHFTWRWCFYINVPIGVVALIGVWIFISGARAERRRKLDFLGYVMLAIFVSAIQLLLDRGSTQDWFSSTEIWVYAVIAMIALWVFIFQTATAEHPFIPPGLIADRNFITANVFGFIVGLLLFSTMALLPPLLQELLDFPVMTSGLLMMPRGLGSLMATLIVGRLIGRVDNRLILVTGLAIGAVALLGMTHFDLSMNSWPILTTGFAQGLGMGMLMIPLTTLAFATVPPELRPDGSALFSLVRNLGSSVGISIMQALVTIHVQTMHASLAAHVTPSNPVMRATLPPAMNPTTSAGLQALDAEINRQATMVAYIDDFKLMFIMTLLCMPMLLLLRRPRMRGGENIHVAVE